MNLAGHLEITGTNLETVTSALLQDEHGETFATVPVTYADGKLSGTVAYEGEFPGIGYVAVSNSAGTDSRGVEFVRH